jgi:hypothetical protein
MARYEIPPDPRDTKDKRPRRLRADSPQPTPWRWLLLGLVVTVVSMALAVMLVNAFLRRPPLETAVPQPTLIILTAPPSAVPSPTPRQPTPTPIPTFTPIPTPDTAVAPPEITVGYYAEVANTGGAGVRVRGGPSTSNAAILVAADGEIVLIIGGPEADELNNQVWWQIQLGDGTEGWAVGDYLRPTAAP